MLESLSIRNLAIIDRLDIEFGAGLNVLTGETGAGKSIVIGALNLILGGRGGGDLVRAGAEKASVDAVFEISSSGQLPAILAEAGAELEDGRLHVSRELLVGGKSSARIQGRPVPVSQLRTIGEWLVDLHGQHEHQQLLAPGRHIEVLDAWAGESTGSSLERVRAAYERLRRLVAERETLETDSRERARLIDLYAFQVEEIRAAGLSPGEEEELGAEAERLANAERLAAAARAAASAMRGDDGPAALDGVAGAVRALDGVVGVDPRLGPLLARIQSVFYELDDVTDDIIDYAEGVEHNPERLERVRERIDLIGRLQRKYGATVSDVVAYGADASERLEALEHGEERAASLEAELAAARSEQSTACAELSAIRGARAAEFSAAVSSELAELAMEHSRFEVGLTPTEPGPRGADRVEMLIATNRGEPLRPLARIASGGEISRVMLAIKSAVARRDSLPTMVFDEIDVGVGGRTAGVIAQKMAGLAANVQILCITHLPQIASRGGAHFHIRKVESGDRTLVEMHRLSTADRVGEVARMLGGAELTPTVIQHAREMLGLGDGE